MRGFILTAVGLAALDLLLQTPSSRIGAALTTPTRWAAEWMDPRTPLIGPKPAAATKPGAQPAAGGGGFSPLGILKNIWNSLV